MLYKKDEFWSGVENKLLKSFNEWSFVGKVPKYLNKARIVSLSKEDGTQYPALGNIRTISILPATMKLLELCLL